MRKRASPISINPLVRLGALGGIRTPNLLIRSQVLYPLSYERANSKATGCRSPLIEVANTWRRLGDLNPGWALRPKPH
jgi:hypothetical protein